MCIDPLSDELYCGASDPCSTSPGTTCGFEQLCIAGSCEDGTTSTYTYTGSTTTLTIPSGVSVVWIEVSGSAGDYGGSTGAAGRGAYMSGEFVVTPGTVLTIYAGGNPGSRAGGECSYVADGSTLLIAGGGGGASVYSRAGGDAPTTEAGTASPNHAGGAGGTGGNGGEAGTGAWGTGGGGGWLTAGGDASGTSGGAVPCKGSEGTTYAGGAGGGYSGGGGVNMDSGWGTGGGGAGGSYNSGTNQANTAGTNTGTGVVTIHY